MNVSTLSSVSRRGLPTLSAGNRARIGALIVERIIIAIKSQEGKKSLRVLRLDYHKELE